MLTAKQAQLCLRRLATTHHKKRAGWAFKTSEGEYSQHDIFIGVKVPDTRIVAKDFATLELDEIKKLLLSKVHEDRLLALIILVNRVKKNKFCSKEICDFYLRNKAQVNNWDLVDVSAEYLLGAYLYNQKQSFIRKQLNALITSKNLWDRRIAMISTFYFIRRNNFQPTLALAKVLLNDDEDLIHKASGWLLREVGNRNPTMLTDFLKLHYKKMPRTMLRYAIEKLPERHRKQYLKGLI